MDQNGVFEPQLGQYGHYKDVKSKLGSNNDGLGGKAAHDDDPNATYAAVTPEPVPPPKGKKR